MSDKTNPRIDREALGDGEGVLVLSYRSENFRALSLKEATSISHLMQMKAARDADKLKATLQQDWRAKVCPRQVKPVLRGSGNEVYLYLCRAIELKAITNDAVHEAYAAAKLD